MKTLVTLSSLIILSISTFAQTQLCDLLPKILEDSKTEFASAKGKLIYDQKGNMTYESKYLIEGKPFGTIKNTKTGEVLDFGDIFFFAFLSDHKTPEEAKLALKGWVESNSCTNNIVILYREPETQYMFPTAEVFVNTGASFHQGNALLEIVNVQGTYYITLSAHKTGSRTYEAIKDAKQANAFSKQLFEALEMSKPSNREKLKGAVRITPETRKWNRYFETPFKFSNADCYLEESDGSEWGPETKYLVIQFSAGKNADNALLETLNKELINQINSSLGTPGYYYYKQDNKYISYHQIDQIGYRRDSNLFSVQKVERDKTVSIYIDIK